MIPYFLLVMIPALFCCVALKEKQLIVEVGNNNYIKQKNLGLIVFFFCLLVLLVLRSETLGRDLPNYKAIFEQYNSYDYQYIFQHYLSLDGQILFVLLNKIVGHFTSNFHTFLVIVAIITIIPQAIVLCDFRKNSLLQIILYVSLSFLSMYFSGIRQGIAMTIGVVAYHYCKEDRLFAFIICCIIALGFHHSAFVLFVMYPVFHAKMNKTTLLAVVPIVSLVFFFNNQIFVFLTDVLSDFSDKYLSETTSTNAYGSLLLYLIFAIFCFYITQDQSSCSKETIGLRNILVLVVLIQCFAPIHYLAMRFNYYFLVFIPRTIAMCVNNAFSGGKKIAEIGKIVIIIFFAYYYVRKVYIGSVTGIGDLDIYPYVPFWR